MECEIHPNVDYLSVPGVLNNQRNFVIECIENFSTSHIIYPPIPLFKKKELSNMSVPIIHIAGVKESGWNPEDDHYKETSFLSNLNTEKTVLLRELR